MKTLTVITHAGLQSVPIEEGYSVFLMSPPGYEKVLKNNGELFGRLLDEGLREGKSFILSPGMSLAVLPRSAKVEVADESKVVAKPRFAVGQRVRYKQMGKFYEGVIKEVREDDAHPGYFDYILNFGGEDLWAIERYMELLEAVA